MKYLFFIFCLSLFSISQASTNFDWTKFYGMYDYVKCEIKNQPVWAEDPQNTQIEISNNSHAPYTLNLTRWPKDAGIILLGYSIEHIDQGKQLEYDEDTQKLSHITESFTIKDGVFSRMWWNNKDINIGRSYVQLKMLQNGNISYTMLLQWKGQPARRETCELKKVQVK